MSRRELTPRKDPAHREPPFEVPVHRLDFRLGNEAPRRFTEVPRGALHHHLTMFTETTLDFVERVGFGLGSIHDGDSMGHVVHLLSCATTPWCNS